MNFSAFINNESRAGSSDFKLCKKKCERRVYSMANRQTLPRW